MAAAHQHNSNQVDKETGECVIRYEIDSQLKAKIYFGGEQTMNAQCIRYQDEAKAQAYFKSTTKLTDGTIVRPRLIAEHKDKQEHIIFYEPFDILFEEWNIQRAIPLIGAREIWWKESIGKVLEAIRKIHKEKCLHAGLDNPRNYVIKETELKVINIGFSWDSNTDLPTHFKKDDFKQFRDFLRGQVSNNNMPSGLDYEAAFLNYFDSTASYDEFVDKLVSHPFLMTHEEQLKYFYDIHQAIDNKTLEDPTGFFNKLKRQPFSQYRGWNSELKRNTFSATLKKAYEVGIAKGSCYDGDDLCTLIAFLRHVYVHQLINSSNSVKVVVEDVNERYEDLLAHLHEIFKKKEVVI